MRMLGLLAVAGALCTSLTNCTTQPAPPATPLAMPASASLAGTKWQLVQFQSMDDAIGTIKPDDPTHYTMDLMADGKLAMQLNCNRAAGRWEAHPAGPTDGRISFIEPAVTRAMCLGPSMDDRIARDLGNIVSYKLVADTLNLALKFDSGIYTWRRIPD